MLGIIAKKDKYIHIGKWQSVEDKSNMAGFRFKIIKSDDSFNTTFNKLEGTEGTMTIETKSGINFGIDDYIYFRGMKFNITKIDSDMTKFGEQAYSRFRTNGTLVTTLYLRKAG